MSVIYRGTHSEESDGRASDSSSLSQIQLQITVKNENTISLEKDIKEEELVNESEFHDSESIDEDDGLVWKGDPTYLPNSPYPDVRFAVSIEDDPTIRLNHWRTWFLTTIFVVVFAGVNQFFSLRYPSLSIDFIVAQVICYPIGKVLAKLPD